MYYALSILVFWLGIISGAESCLSKPPDFSQESPPCRPLEVIPSSNQNCNLDMDITNNLQYLSIASGSVIMVAGSVWGGSLTGNLTSGNSTIIKFSGRSREERSPSLYFLPKPYCCPGEGGNETMGTIFLNIYEPTNLTFRESAITRAVLGIKWNAACNNKCNDWIELRLAPSHKSFTREYFYEEPVTTVMNANERANNGARKEMDVDFVMYAPNKNLDAVAMVENSEVIVTAKIETNKGDGNRVMKIVVHPNNLKKVVIISAVI